MERHNAVLYGARLDDARLDGASLYLAGLDGSSLRRANLSGADLFLASLAGTRMDGANLSNAYLVHTLFHGAAMPGANFSGAVMSGVRAKASGALPGNCPLRRSGTGGSGRWRRCHPLGGVSGRCAFRCPRPNAGTVTLWPPTATETAAVGQRPPRPWRARPTGPEFELPLAPPAAGLGGGGLRLARRAGGATADGDTLTPLVESRDGADGKEVIQ